MVRSDLENQLIESWEDAEVSIKLAEMVGGQVVVPAVKELRYAGRRMIEAMHAEDDATRQRLLQDAISNCRRAHQDAADASVAYMAIYSDALARKVGYARLGPEFVEFLKTLTGVQEKIASSRRGHDIDQHYREIQASLPALYEQFNRLRLSPGILEWSQKSNGWPRIALTALVSLIAGVLVSGLFAALQWGAQ